MGRPHRSQVRSSSGPSAELRAGRSLSRAIRPAHAVRIVEDMSTINANPTFFSFGSGMPDWRHTMGAGGTILTVFLFAASFVPMFLALTVVPAGWNAMLTFLAGMVVTLGMLVVSALAILKRFVDRRRRLAERDARG